MPPKWKAQMAGTGNANAPTTKGTRRTRAQAEAGPEPESEVEAETAQKTPQVTRFEKHKGNYQPSTLPRRNAPAPPRGDSPESISTDFFEHSTYDETMGFSPEKRPASPPREFSPAKRRSSEKPREPTIPEESETSHGGDFPEKEIRVAGERIEESLSEIIDFILPDLATWTSRIYDVVVKAQSTAPDMHVWTRLALIESNFNEQRRKIASTEGYLIHPKDIYKSVRTIEGTEHLKFATKTIYSANTALLLQFLLQTKYGQNRISTQQLLDELDEVFPEMFVGGAAANISEETYEMAFWIRCCLLIEVIRERRDTIPAILAVELFCSVEPPKRKKECKELLLQGPYAPLGGLVIENMKDVAVRHTQNLEKICGEVLAHKARADIITSLGNVYPLEDLWNELTQWAHETYKKLHEGPKDAEEENKNLAAVAAPTRLNQNHRQAQKASEVSSRVAVQAATKHQIDKQQSQEQEYEQHSEERQIADQLTVQKHGDEQMEMGDSDDQDDLFVDKERSDPESEVDEPIVRTGRWGGSYLDGSASLVNDGIVGGHPRATPPSNQQAARNPIARLNAEEVVDNLRFGQPLAVRWSSQPGTGRNQANQRKRAAPDDEARDKEGDEGPVASQEFGFEVDDRPVNKGRRIVIMRQTTQPVSNRAHMVEDRTGSIVGDRRSMSLSANSHKHGGELQADDVSLLSQKARAVARENRERRPPQKRERWSDSDTAALINAIPLHMCAWSQMEEASLFESVRTQQQIRDKARNIKVDFLKTNDPLPAGFDCIALGKKEIDSIKALGLNPSRKEDDIDDNGRVINNVWDPEFEVEESRRHRSEEEN